MNELNLGATRSSDEIIAAITDLAMTFNEKPINDIMDATMGVPQTGKPRVVVTEGMINRDREAAEAIKQAIRVMIGGVASLAYNLGLQHGEYKNRGEDNE